MRRAVTRCPVCEAGLFVAEMRCETCDTTLRGSFEASRCAICDLPQEQQAFLELFLRCRGNLRDVERALGVSYPTVRARLDSLLNRLGYAAAAVAQEPPGGRREILEALSDGRIAAEDAIRMLQAL